ncbi:hypothetical protein CERSUDRAFT_116585 [Gelatoporia subvermispora B]|uniref:DUF159-domain-containing protein n=1 Tax=Ceriporiopsis subvermispora (strain B) TaxID=914234 RepID=M2QST0_CERS8|nr:hypothetical protein CERSUDRAFT_116585 [Gelatoporia subvermispora B]
MCGRYSLGRPRNQIQHLPEYNVQAAVWVAEDQFAPRHNIAPRSFAPVVRRREPDELPDQPADTLMLHTMKWGLVPHWSKHEDASLSTTNARAEKLLEGGGMWGSIKGKRRCAVLCEGYYEWLKKGKERLPHFTRHKDGRLMLLAGLYDRAFLEGSNEPLYTYTIVTTDANKEFSWLHDRQPVILSSPEASQKWLDTSSEKWNPELTKLLNPYSDTTSPLVCYQVPKEVGKVGTESPTFIQPIAERKDGIAAMFVNQKQARSSPASPARAKPKRNTSPPPTKADPAEQKPPTEKLNAWESDSEIEYIDSSAPSPEVKIEKVDPTQDRSRKRKASPTKGPRETHKASKGSSSSSALSPKKQKLEKACSSSKITDFFGKP